MTTGSASGPAAPRRGRLRQQTAKAARWLHIYLSMVSFTVVLFFAVTGLTVNHPEWFARNVTTREVQGRLDAASVAAGNTEAGQHRLIDLLRTREHLHGAVGEVRTDDAEISFSYRAPGYSADATLDRQHGTYTIIEVRNGFVAVLNDLHKGRDAGAAWHTLIDASAVLLTLVSLTGLVILWFVYRRRSSGLVLAAVGLLVCVAVFHWLVP